MRRGLLILVLLAMLAPAQARAERRVEVLVTLEAPPLARAVASSRVLTVAARRSRLDLESPTSVAYLNALTGQQRTMTARIRRAIPSAEIRRRYRIVLNGLAVVVPANELRKLASLAGVRRIDASVRYRAQLDRSPATIGAPTLWGPTFSTAGSGVKIAILDDGIDRTHPFFQPRGYVMPPGYPKGNRRFTTAKVIAARTFAPRSPSWRYARRPFDPMHSFHGTHVAGIAAGNAGVFRGASPRRMSGVAPRAYLGNYKVLTIPTASGVGLDGNAPEIVAGIEAAVRDGMDVINVSLGQPEIEPARDIVARALDAAADAGVVPVAAAGNDFAEFGIGSVASPGTAAKAITVGAWGGGGDGRVLRFSASGPTAISHRLKPDIVAPGAAILSSVPRREGTWAEFDGTSMAAPHVSGAAALLRQRHPTWRVWQVKSALVASAQRLGETLRAGGGLADLVRAADPRVFTAPSSLSFGVLPRGGRATRAVALTDAGGGNGAWDVSVRSPGRGVTVAAPTTVTVPGALRVSVTVGARAAAQGDYTGFVTLSRVSTTGGIARRIPFWVGVTAPRLGRHRARALNRAGTYSGNTAGRPALVSTYRYPTGGGGTRVRLDGPEQVFRVRLRRSVANFGVVVLPGAPGVRVQARIVAARDENRLVGYASLPFNLNPYLESFLEPRPVAGAIRPRAGSYDIVFDSRNRAAAGRFRFRFWIGDTTPPRVRLLTRSVRRGSSLVLTASDRGSGVDPGSLTARVDGRRTPVRFVRGRVVVDVRRVARGRHRLVVQVSDYQETRNTENVLRILPNTRRLSVVFSVR